MRVPVPGQLAALIFAVGLSPSLVACKSEKTGGLRQGDQRSSASNARAQAEPSARTGSETTATQAPTTDPTHAKTCRYIFKEVRTETVGEEPLAAHTVTVEYSLTYETPTGSKSASVEVQELKVTAKRAGYALTLDAQTPGVMHRVRAGGELAILFGPLSFFAFIGPPIDLSFDTSGALKDVEDAEDLRARLFDMLPPKQRQEEHFKRQVDEVFATQEIATIFDPASTAWPATEQDQDRDQGTTQGTEPLEIQLEGLRGVGQTAWRKRPFKDTVLFEQKSAFGSSPGPGPGPETSDIRQAPETGQASANTANISASRRTLIAGASDLTVRINNLDPCFLEAGASLTYTVHDQSPDNKDAATAADRKVVRTRVWTRSAAAEKRTPRGT